MISVQELIIHLEKKIVEYRYAQKRIGKAKSNLRSGHDMITAFNTQIKGQILGQIGKYKGMAEESLIKVNDYFENLMQKQKRCYQRQIYDLRLEIQRQYKVISSMRQEVEDLQELIIMQNAKNQTSRQDQEQGTQEANHHKEEEEKNRDLMKMKTVYGLQVIEEETQRTVMSSVKSFHEQNRSSNENFIRIQEKENQSYSQSDCISNKKSSVVQIKQSHHKESICQNSQISKNQEDQSMSEHPSQQKSSISKGIMNSSNVSKRQNTYQFDQNSEEAFERYESLPLTIDGYITKEFNAKQFTKQKNKEEAGGSGCNELREITNQINEYSSQEDRQYKTKMFLQQFRKTFNRCLSSANISRKQSGKAEKTAQKSKSREDKRKTSREKVKTSSKADNQKSDNQKLLNDMLKDTHNNSKFCVGDRRTEQKYDGEKKDNAKHGNGKLFYSNGLCYEGQFKNNLRHGYGILRFNQIQIYRGEWQDDQLSGQGKIRNFAVINKIKSQSNPSPLLKWVSYCGYFKKQSVRRRRNSLPARSREVFRQVYMWSSLWGRHSLQENGEIETGIWRNNQLVEQF